MSSGAGGRDLSRYVNHIGHIKVRVQIGNGPGVPHEHTSGASATPKMVAAFLRDLADDIEHAATQSQP